MIKSVHNGQINSYPPRRRVGGISCAPHGHKPSTERPPKTKMLPSRWLWPWVKMQFASTPPVHPNLFRWSFVSLSVRNSARNPSAVKSPGGWSGSYLIDRRWMGTRKGNPQNKNYYCSQSVCRISIQPSEGGRESTAFVFKYATCHLRPVGI